MTSSLTKTSATKKHVALKNTGPAKIGRFGLTGKDFAIMGVTGSTACKLQGRLLGCTPDLANGATLELRLLSLLLLYQAGYDVGRC